jgi:hypothetical protein
MPKNISEKLGHVRRAFKVIKNTHLALDEAKVVCGRMLVAILL